MSNRVFDEQQGNSVSCRVQAQRNWERGAAEAVGAADRPRGWLKLTLIVKWGRGRGKRKGERSSACGCNPSWPSGNHQKTAAVARGVIAVEKTKGNQCRAIDGNLIFFIANFFWRRGVGGRWDWSSASVLYRQTLLFIEEKCPADWLMNRLRSLSANKCVWWTQNELDD